MMPGDGPAAVPTSYRDLMVNAAEGRITFLYPETITRDGDRVRYDGLMMRAMHRPVRYTDDLWLFEFGAAGGIPQPHVALPLLWAWAIGQRKGMREHPAGECRDIFRRRFP